MTRDSLRIWIVGANMALWLLSLILPAAGWGHRGPIIINPGIFLLLWGFLEVFSLQFGWVANVFFLWSMPFAIGRRPRSKERLFFASAAIALPAIQTLWWHEIHTDLGASPVVVGPGYYSWLTAMLSQAAWLVVRAQFYDSDDERPI